jgi:CRISPR/Cas system-associated endonuclease/helicase Cas3
MTDKAKIQSDYENLRKVQYTDLLPLDKVIELEEAKEMLTEKYLSKIKSISCSGNKYTLETDGSFTLSDLLDKANEVLGDVNYIEKDNENGLISIDVAFTYGIIGMLYSQENFKYSITVFWDI